MTRHVFYHPAKNVGLKHTSLLLYTVNYVVASIRNDNLKKE
jgi:hypothetical protein